MMTNGQQMIHRVIPDSEACPGCGYLARILRQTAEPPAGGLVAQAVVQLSEGTVVEQRARVMDTWALCFNCLRSEHWGWEEGEWKLLEVHDFRLLILDHALLHSQGVAETNYGS